MRPLPHVEVVMINGGGSPEQNFRSHLRHLDGMLSRLIAAGVVRSHVTVFSADGADPTPDLAVVEEAPPEAWRLDGTPLEATVRRHGGLTDSQLNQTQLYPATRGALAVWFLTAASQLVAGDTLFLYVTDHGSRGSIADGGSRITLWGAGESLSVRDLRGLLEGLDPQVRVVMVMSQCFSGGFAALTDLQATERPPGSVCGFFSAPADRPAYGCYAEDRGRDGVGHTFALLRALASDSQLGNAHETVLATDRTPDVPLRTTEVFLEQRLRRAAGAAGQEPEAFADALLAELDEERHGTALARIARIAEAFGLTPTHRVAELQRLSMRLGELMAEAKRRARASQAALEVANRASLARFVATHPAWRARLDPAALGALGAAERYDLAIELLGPMRTAGAGEPDGAINLEALARDRDDSKELAYRMEVRAAAVLRMRNQLLALAGQMELDRAGSTAERAELEELRHCEAFDLPLGGTAPVAESEPPSFPTLAADGALLGEEVGAAPAVSGPMALSMAPYRGAVPRSLGDGRARLLFFWATWCGPCKAALPQLLAFSSHHDVPILAISSESRQTLDTFFARFHAPFPDDVAIDADQQMTERFSVSGLPTFVLIDAKGKVAAQLVGNSEGLGATLAASLPGT